MRVVEADAAIGRWAAVLRKRRGEGKWREEEMHFVTKSAYREIVTRKFAPEYRIFTRVSKRNAFKNKELGMAKRLHSLVAWEELAEDPFRGLRAGPADFSPFSF
jgi:hypothetical protein